MAKAGGFNTISCFQTGEIRLEMTPRCIQQHKQTSVLFQPSWTTFIFMQNSHHYDGDMIGDRVIGQTGPI